MASNAKLVSAFVVNRISFLISRRGYAAAAAASQSQGVVSGGAKSSSSSVVMMKKGSLMEETTTKKKESWVPDPKTGYYRPENHAKEIDPAELREMLLKHKFSPKQH